MSIEIPIKLLVDPTSGRSAQTEFFNLTKRHQAFSGGYGNGKSYAASIKGLTLLGTFPKYRIAICRRSVTDLKRSTMSTFFKVCPPALYDDKKGGNRADSLNYLRLINGSEVFWLHLDDADESTVRGLEVNSVIIDQAEEISENMYRHLSARVGRWDQAVVPPEMLRSNPEWPRDFEGKPKVPNYMMILCNPDHEMHWIYINYHPDSLYWFENNREDYEMVEASSGENPTLDPATLRDMMQNDPIWVRRFVLGKWGIPGGTIHNVSEDSVLGVEGDASHCHKLTPEFITNLRRSGQIYRILDHGDASPTACGWVVTFHQWFFFIREYYRPGLLVSEHRRNIDALSRFDDGSPERYAANWADPDIFKKDQQKKGGFWSTADEYLDPKIDVNNPPPPIAWIPADNNEYSTRNRISEYLRPNEGVRHPVTGIDPAPRLYFIQRSEIYPHGCYHIIKETKSQKRKLLDTINGRPIYADERDESIPDHGYDLVRYFTAMHPYWSKTNRVNAPRGSFDSLRLQMKAWKKSGRLNEIFGNVPAGLGSY